MLQVRGVSKAFDGGRERVPVLADVSLAVAPGERVARIGKSGAGKSTLAQIMALLLPPDRGTVWIDGAAVTAWGLRAPAQVRQQVQLIWQSPRLSTDPRHTLEQIIAEPLRSLPKANRHAAREQLARLCERVGLTDDLLRRHPHAVSDGQLQRVCLIRALVVQPKYLLCDECTAMLDASTQATLLHTIAEEQARTRMGVLFITHDHRLARAWCDRVLVLAEGRVVGGGEGVGCRAAAGAEADGGAER